MSGVCHLDISFSWLQELILEEVHELDIHKKSEISEKDTCPAIRHELERV